MTRPVYDCKDPNCFTCRMAFRTVEGLTAAVVEEARAVVEAEKDADALMGKELPEDADEALADAHAQNVQEAEQDMIAMVVRLANALGALDAFRANAAATPAA